MEQELAKIKSKAERLILLLSCGAFPDASDELFWLKRIMRKSDSLTESQREFLTDEIITKAEKQVYHYEKTLKITKSVANKMAKSLDFFNQSN